jgi:hypothetical protein
MASAWQAETRQTEADLKTPQLQRASRDWRRASLRSKPEPVVLFMCTDPEPRDHVTAAQTQCPVVFADPHNTDVVTALLESKRRMMRVSLPEGVFFSR